MLDFSNHFVRLKYSSNKNEKIFITYSQVVQNIYEFLYSVKDIWNVGNIMSTSIDQITKDLSFGVLKASVFLSLAKKNKKKGKTLTLNDFLADDSSGNAPPSYPSAKTTSWADETDDLDGDGK